MVKEKLTINGEEVYYTPIDIKKVLSTHYNQEQRLYEIWDDTFFVIYKHDPWIDVNILNSKDIINSIIRYTQLDNKIVEVYHISDKYIITKFYKDYYPCLIKSSVMFYNYETYLQRSDKHYDYFKDFNTAKKFYQNILSEYRAFHSETKCYFKDDAANNFIVNEDYSDYKILDFGCLIYDPNKNIRIRQLLDAIGGTNGIDDMHIFGKRNFTQKNRIIESWEKSINTIFHIRSSDKNTIQSINNASLYTKGNVSILTYESIKDVNEWIISTYDNKGYNVWIDGNYTIPEDLIFILDQLQLSGQLIDIHKICMEISNTVSDLDAELIQGNINSANIVTIISDSCYENINLTVLPSYYIRNRFIN